MSDKQWQVLAKHFAEMNKRGRPREHSARNMINAIFHIQATGLPVARTTQGLPALQTGLQHLCPLASARRAGRSAGAAAPARARQGRKAGQAQHSHHRLSIGQDRLKRGQRGYDAGKRVKGRKRHIASDTMGLLAVVAPSAGIQDRAGARALLIRLFLYFESLKTIFVDGSYSGSLINWALSMFGCE